MGVVIRWHEWMHVAKDVGIQTSSVLRAAAHHGISTQTASAASPALHQRSGRTAGNGSLMHTVPVALAYLDDEAALVEAARVISELTHYDADAGDACVLWCLAIRHTILTGALDVRIGLQHLPADRRDMWASLLDTAESSRPQDFPTTAGSFTHCRPPGRRSPPRRYQPRPGCRTVPGPITSAWHWTQRCGAAMTPTPSLPSPVGCSVLSTGLQPCLPSGGAYCTAGQVWRPGTWLH
jgi:hypothetical protein